METTEQVQVQEQEDGVVKPPTEYLVEIVERDADSLVFYRSAGSVIVPARTTRKKALETAAAELPILQRAISDDRECVVRLLAVDDVYEQSIGYKQPPPTLVIGDAP